MKWRDKVNRWQGKLREMDREAVFDKLEELRAVLIRTFILIAILSCVSYLFWKDVLHFLQKPLGIPLIMFSLPEAFVASLKLALFTGIFVAVPYLLNGVWGMLAPYFSSSKRRLSLPFVLSASALFYSGTFFCYYFVLPVAIRFLVNYGSDHLQPMIGLSRYLTFTVGLMFAFGVVFELPLIMLVLGRIGIVNDQWLAKNRKYAFLVNAVLSALITPTPDAYTMCLMMIPIQILYEGSIWLVKIFCKKKTLEAELVA